MGKTYKDQRKYEKKVRHREEDMAGKSVPRKNRKHYEEIIPDDEPLNPYEIYDYDDYE